MNYIILNGVNSNTIKGLLISNLPPISKPAQKVEIEEIDGRDGDIITPLGYTAYDKSFDIGLYGEFDINQVISYFNSEGIVTFSNEPDKYYKYQIVAQIDFEKLLRFKTATIIMHVQPFKYSTEEENINYNGYTSAEGKELNLKTVPLEPEDFAISGDLEQVNAILPERIYSGRVYRINWGTVYRYWSYCRQ